MKPAGIRAHADTRRGEQTYAPQAGFEEKLRSVVEPVNKLYGAKNKADRVAEILSAAITGEDANAISFRTYSSARR